MIEHLHFFALQVNAIVQKCYYNTGPTNSCLVSGWKLHMGSFQEASAFLLQPQPQTQAQAEFISKSAHRQGHKLHWDLLQLELLVWKAEQTLCVAVRKWALDSKDQLPTTAKMWWCMMLASLFAWKEAFVGIQQYWLHQKELSHAMLSKHLDQTLRQHQSVIHY